MGEEICGRFQQLDPESGRCRLNVPDCIGKAATSAIAGTAVSGPKGGALAGGLRYTICKTIQTVESIETGRPRQRHTEPSTQNQWPVESNQQITVDDREPYYQEPDPLLDEEFDAWEIADDRGRDIKTDFDLSADQGSLYSDSSKNSMKSWA